MTTINGGKLTQKIGFYLNLNQSDGAGGIAEGQGHQLVLETWSSIKQIKASRVVENLQESLNAVYEIKLRKRADFKPQSNYTLIWNDKSCEIIEITEDIEANNQWVLIVVNRGISI